MLSDRKLLERFEQAILDKDISDIQSEIAAHKRISVTAQAAIYINGYRLRLLRVLQADYPALLHLLGEKEFERLAIAYIEANPSLDFNIDRYPHKFADFISTMTNSPKIWQCLKARSRKFLCSPTAML